MSSNFSASYLLSLLAAFSSVYFVSKNAPNVNSILVFFVLPLIVAYLFLQIFNLLIPKVNDSGDQVSTYITNSALGKIYNTDYIQMYPPLFSIFVIVFILLFSSRLG